jgi:hypothetical protein
MTVQCDPHRRAASEEQADNIIAGNRQRTKNKLYWLKLAKQSIDDMLLEQAIDRIKQAMID